MLTSLKTLIKRYPTLLRAARFLKYRGRKHRVLVATDMAGLTNQWIKVLPSSFDLVVGVPRAGLMIADAIALYYGIPFATPNGLCRGELFFTHDAVMPKVSRVLVVEDYIEHGSQLKVAAELVQNYLPDAVVKTGSLFVASKAKDLVDYYFKEMNFLIPQWDIIKVKKEHSLVSDLDGVLCKDPPASALLSDESFKRWVESAEPSLVPRYTIDAIVTCRSAVYRRETEAWLERNNVVYNELFMFNGGLNPSLPEAVAFKSECLKRLHPSWFWESDPRIAEAVSKKTGIRVLCTDNMEVYE